MTAPGATTASFQGVFTPAQVAAILNTLVDQAPFAASLTRAQSRTGRMAFPVAGPTGFAWLNELDPLPVVDLNDDAEISAVAKLAGIVLLSNEATTDPTVNMTNALGTLLRDSLSAQLDDGLLNGGGPPAPDGIIAKAPAVADASLLGATAQAIGQIGDAGGQATTLAASATLLATENARLAPNGGLLYPQGFGAAVGLTAVAVPNMSVPLVYDSRRVYLVLGQDSTAEYSKDFAFGKDATAIRVKARVNVAAPVATKAIRKLTVSGTQAETRPTRSK